MTGESRGTAGKAHERSRQLLAAGHVEGLSAAEREWLDRHLEECSQCAEEAGALVAAVRVLRTSSPLASPELVQRTRLAVRRFAAQRANDRAHGVPLWIAVTLSGAWMLLTAPTAWWICGWLGRAARVPDAVWQVGFLVWWFLPATLLAAILAWRHAGRTPEGTSGMAHVNWGQL
jgi:anti-sigma factor RsiW